MKKALKIFTMLSIGSCLVSCDISGTIKNSSRETQSSSEEIVNKTQFLTGTEAPSNEIGNVGDTYLNIKTYDTYIKYASGWKLTSSIKDQTTDSKEDDKTTTSTRSGEGEPSDDLGIDGDSYIDLLTYNYYVKSNGKWEFKVCLKNSQDSGDYLTYIPCVFYNEDGTKLYETYVVKGEDVTYEGVLPTKGDTQINGHTVHWRFSGWDNLLENIEDVTVFRANFECYVNVTFRNYDGTILDTQEVSFGDTPVYSNDKPERVDSEEISWTFAGWDKSITNVYEDTEYTAKFSSEDAIEITFENYDGTILETTSCLPGEDVSYSGYIPYKPDYNDQNGTIIYYEFFGWDKPLTNVCESTTFKPLYMQHVSYECTFLDYDGSVLDTHYVNQNEAAYYLGNTPTIDYVENIDEGITSKYEFSGWDKSTYKINAPTTFTACFNKYYYYECSFLDYEGTTIETFDVKEGEGIYQYINTYREDDVNDGTTIKYYFERWDHSTDYIYSPTTFRPIFFEEKYYKCTFVDEDDKELETMDVLEGNTARPQTTFDSVIIDETHDDYVVKKEFFGWDHKLTNISEPTTFKTIFKNNNYYKCFFQNTDGTILETVYVLNGGSAVYTKDTPTREEEEHNGVITRYTFTSWNEATTNIKSSSIFTPSYEEETLYRCYFVNDNDEVLQECVVASNGEAKYTLTTPFKDFEVDGTQVTEYIYTGWNTSTTNITESKTIKAVYNSEIYEGYVVTYEDESGTVLSKTGVKTGEDSYYKGDWDELTNRYFSYDSNNVTMWVGWDKSESNINETKTLTVKTKTITRQENGEYPFTYVLDEDLISSLDKLYQKYNWYKDDNDATNYIDQQGYYIYNGEKYKYGNYGYINGKSYRWQKVEPVKWRYLSTDGMGNYQFVTLNALIEHNWNGSNENYDDGSYANNYAKSDIRLWLNNDFLNEVFYYDQSKLVSTFVDNSINTICDSSSTSSYELKQYEQYVCMNTNDKIYLLSYQDVNNEKLGFSNKQYATNSKIVYNASGEKAVWWLRSPGDYYSSCHAGSISYNSTNGKIYYSNYSLTSNIYVRPACTLNLGL